MKQDIKSIDKQYSIVDLIGLLYNIKNHSGNTLSTVEHDSLVIWPSTNSFTWFSRQISGGPYTWLKYVLHLDDYEIEEYLELVPELNITHLFSESEQTIEVRYPIGQRRHCEYFTQRGINENTSTFFDLEVYQSDVIIPLYNYFGNRCGSLLRKSDTNDVSKKYRKIINEEVCNLWPNKLLKERFTKPVYVFEGTWSVMRWWQVAGDSITPLALIGLTAGTETIALLNGIENVTFILDNDKESKAGLTVFNRIIKEKNYNKNLGWKFVIPPKYPDEMTDEEILIMLNEIRKIRQE